MTFINEHINQEDIEKYHISEIDKQFLKGHLNPHWTIDRERNIYLRHMHNEREEKSNRHTYYLYWNGSQIIATIDKYANQIDGDIHWHYKLWRIEIPTQMEDRKPTIIADLKEALKAYKVRGIYSEGANFNVDFDF